MEAHYKKGNILINSFEFADGTITYEICDIKKDRSIILDAAEFEDFIGCAISVPSRLIPKPNQLKNVHQETLA